MRFYFSFKTVYGTGLNLPQFFCNRLSIQNSEYAECWMIFRGVWVGLCISRDQTPLIIEFKLWNAGYFYKKITVKYQHFYSWAWNHLSVSRSSLLSNRILPYSFRLSWNPLSLRDCRIGLVTLNYCHKERKSLMR